MSNEDSKKESILTTLFETREENLSNNSQSIERVIDSLDSYIDKINIIGAYKNQKFYKIRVFGCYKFNIRMCMSISIFFKREYIVNNILPFSL